VVANYATFKDKASVIMVMGWVKSAIKDHPENTDHSQVYAELLKVSSTKE
jgi:hypothetical protein